MSGNAVTKSPLVQLKILDERLQCIQCHFLLNGPLQLQCGHRLCTPCAVKLKQQSSQTLFCDKCQKYVESSKTFHDKAIAKEIECSVITCPQCGWTGEYRNYQKHLKEGCQLIKVSCPNEGCGEEIIKSQLDEHLQQCYRRQLCQLCKKESCTCRDQHKMDLHLGTQKRNSFGKKQTLMKDCEFHFLKCCFRGNDVELERHMEESQKDHLLMVRNYLSCKSPQKLNGVTSIGDNGLKLLLYTKLDKINEKLGRNENKENGLQIAELQGQQKDITFRLTGVEDLLATLQASINEINRTYEEVSLTLQTLQATSYDGHNIWKIPDITRRRRDALLGKTVSLYSAPFYTSRFGYRLCLRVYLYGDGSGKGRYISYFLTIMKGEYDALLEWPFQHMVTMTLVNQKGNNNIVQSFRPNPTSTSFHCPKSDMNVASGCPKFAPISILDNPEFVVDDVAFFKCDISVNKS
ncbi:TNF receptor-associated factor 3-like isoform X2 [Dysidea avara]|uniref:TNF receptor-associated factor 3-like isoform X2 n=1 Tax=Dysidea avara TaxID=196820 RepID=UPI00333421F4